MLNLTEAEAKTKWCPFVRYQSRLDAPAANRWKQQAPPEEPDALNPVACRCIASACMAWRWMDDETAPPSEELKRHEDSMRRGYCGLAGRPT